MYVHSSLDFNVLFRGYSDIELLAVSISINRHYNICLSVAYHPPSSPAHFLNVFFEAICELHTYKLLIAITLVFVFCCLLQCLGIFLAKLPGLFGITSVLTFRRLVTCLIMLIGTLF